MEKVAIILLRSLCNLSQEERDTLKMLHLSRRQHCSVFELTPTVAGMLNKLKDTITFGVISEETHNLLKSKKGEKDPNNGKELKNLFRLNSPRGGYERKGIKIAYTAGGALGKRDNIDELIKKMI
jgi:ribosomal protein L30/L7E